MKLSKEWLSALLFLLGLVLLYMGYRYYTSQIELASAPLNAREQQELRSFEQERLRDSAHFAQEREAQWQAQKAEWEAEKAARAKARAEREDSFTANKARWAAEKAERHAAAQARQAHWDSIRSLRPQKLRTGECIVLNNADTLQLQQIPGIGKGLARSIVRYRERLGGFVNVAQVYEIPYIPQGTTQWLRLNSDERPRQLAINSADFKTLLAHPYLEYEQVKEIVNRRRAKGVLRSWNDLRNSPHFSEKDFERLTPYVHF